MTRRRSKCHTAGFLFSAFSAGGLPFILTPRHTRAGELDEIEALAEWISQIGHAAVLTDLDVSIRRTA